MFTRRLLSACVLAVALAVTAPAAVIAQDERLDAKGMTDLVEKTLPAIVTIKFVMKFSGGDFGGFGMGDRETESEGVMIDPKGVILCSNLQLGGFGSLMGARMGGMTITPSDIKILIGDDTVGIDATLIARDSELDLAWIKINEPGDRKFDHLDLDKAGSEPAIGQSLYAVERLGKFFDRAPVVREGRIGGVTKKPRKLFVPSMGLANSFGVPVFDAKGKIVGISAFISPDSEDEEEMGSMWGSSWGEGFVLPASEVVKATKRALELQDAAGNADSDR